jgi:hypothetical protein
LPVCWLTHRHRCRRGLRRLPQDLCRARTLRRGSDRGGRTDLSSACRDRRADTGPVGDGIAAVVASGVSHRICVGRERFGEAQIQADVLPYLQLAEIAGQTQDLWETASLPSWPPASPTAFGYGLRCLLTEDRRVRLPQSGDNRRVRVRHRSCGRRHRCRCGLRRLPQHLDMTCDVC